MMIWGLVWAVWLLVEDEEGEVGGKVGGKVGGGRL